MGTNYYLQQDLCPHCGHTPEPLHIGKSSGGWTFALRIYPGRGIHDLWDWMHEFYKHPIKDEYEGTITRGEMLRIITERSRDEPLDWSEEKLRLNHAEPGPNNLVRARIDGIHCVGHGEGTWDLFRGEFC